MKKFFFKIMNYNHKSKNIFQKNFPLYFFSIKNFNECFSFYGAKNIFLSTLNWLEIKSIFHLWLCEMEVLVVSCNFCFIMFPRKCSEIRPWIYRFQRTKRNQKLFRFERFAMFPINYDFSSLFHLKDGTEKILFLHSFSMTKAFWI